MAMHGKRAKGMQRGGEKKAKAVQRGGMKAKGYKLVKV